MIRRFGPEKAKQISRECDQMAMKLMEVIEERYGSMMEFGMDVGVDVKGNVWLIEANPKPSHSIFLGTKEMGMRRI
nr:YheC/YheD family protein [Paenibacillus castaneae]